MIYNSLTFQSFIPTYKEDIQLDDYLPVCCGFDIETTTVEHKAYMYHWQLSINDDVVIGRTWDEFLEVLQLLSDKYDTNSKRLLVWDHNYQFEFQFLKKRIRWMKNKEKPCIFAMDKRQVVYAVTEHNIEFRDSAVFTGMSLAKLAKTFCKTQKMVGDLDYSILRNSKTPMKPKELQYCLNDVIILSEFAYFTFKRYGDKIPLTKTGIVRNKLKTRFKALDKEEKLKHRKFIRRCFPSENQYRTWFDWIYRGGWVHANFEIVDRTINQPGDGYDFKSSYIYEFFEKMPTKYTTCKPSIDSINWILDRIDDYGFYVKINIKNLKRKTCHSVFSLHKTLMDDDAIYSCDNGRLTYCSECTMMLTEWDWLDLVNFYTGEVEIEEMMYTKKEYLPKWILDQVYEYFYIKENAAPGIDKTLAKSDLNCMYGMAVTSIIQNDILFDETTGMFEDGEAREFNKLVYSQILLPQWGIAISAHSRHRILQLCYEITINSEGTSDAYYGDTDSLKIFNTEKHLPIIEAYNNKVMVRNKKIQELFGYDLKQLGCFMWENKIIKFKSLGCKRYIYTTDDNETHVVVAGMPKHAMDKYLSCPKFDIYKYFTNKLILPPGASEKMTSKYNDEQHSDIVDGEVMTELSSIALFNIPFTMTMDADYFALIKKNEERPILFRKRGGQ